jgi:hypothetical protein
VLAAEASRLGSDRIPEPCLLRRPLIASLVHEYEAQKLKEISSCPPLICFYDAFLWSTKQNGKKSKLRQNDEN